MPVYPNKISDRAANPRFADSVSDANAVGVSASLTCGSFVRFYLRIDPDSLAIEDSGFHSNGCGFAVATADRLAEAMRGQSLADLHGLDESEVMNMLESDLGPWPEERVQCAEICVSAFRSALAAFRKARADEYTGEKALICSCFGVGEETIERAIDTGGLDSVAAVTNATNAGAGCGSCRMLIQEIIDDKRSGL